MDEFPLHSQLPLGKSLAERRGAEQRAQLMSHQHKGLPWKMWTYLGSIEERWPPEVPGCSPPRSELKLIRGLPKQPSKNQKEAPGAVCKKRKNWSNAGMLCVCVPLESNTHWVASRGRKKAAAALCYKWHQLDFNLLSSQFDTNPPRGLRKR